MAEMEVALQQVIQLLLPLGPIVAQRWFGAWALDLDDRIFAIYHEGVLYLRTCEDSAAEFLDHGSYPLRLPVDDEADADPLPFHAVPDDVLEDPDTTCAWAYAALIRCA